MSQNDIKLAVDMFQAYYTTTPKHFIEKCFTYFSYISIGPKHRNIKQLTDRHAETKWLIIMPSSDDQLMTLYVLKSVQQS